MKTALLRNIFRKSGLDGFQNHEALELLLSFHHSAHKSKDLTNKLIKKHDGIRGVFDAPIEDLEATLGLDSNAVIQIKLTKDLAGLYLKERIIKKDVLNNKHDLLCFLSYTLACEKIEKFFAVYLNSKNELLEMEFISEGIVDQVAVYPRKVVKGALMHDASSIILVHNHPSGDATPTVHDFELTKKIVVAASAIDIGIHDHIIIGNNNYFSGRDHGWLTHQSTDMIRDDNPWSSRTLHE